MALILAIEGDRRQATLLATIGRRVGAELVIAPTAERGLEAIDGRVPDLILTSALLSPRDDAAIAARLRELDTAASHVQMLTIPLLAKAARRQTAPGGLLGKLRGPAFDATPDGCDPSLFAEQVREYLDRAAAECAARQDAEHAQPGERGAIDDESIGSVRTAIAGEQTEATLDPRDFPIDSVAEDPRIDVSQVDRATPFVEAPAAAIAGGHEGVDRDEYVAPSATEVPREILQADLVRQEIAIELSSEPLVRDVSPEPFGSDVSPDALARDLSRGPVVELVLDEPPIETPEIVASIHFDITPRDPALAEAGVVPLFATAPEPAREPGPLAEDETAGDDEIELAEELDTEPDVVELNASTAGTDIDAALREFEAALAEAESSDAQTRASERLSPDLDAAVPVIELSAEPDIDASAIDIWTELSRAAAAWPPLEGATGDDTGKTVKEAAAADAISGAVPPRPVEAGESTNEPAARFEATRADFREPPDPNAAEPVKKLSQRRRKGKPPQDEWGLFDPDQCGFAALLEKLDEIASADDAA